MRTPIRPAPKARKARKARNARNARKARNGQPAHPALTTLLGTLLAIVGIAALAAPASAGSNEIDTATSAHYPSGVVMNCVHRAPGGTACFHTRGDVFWVEDTASDGDSVIASWAAYKYSSSSKAWVYYRGGACVNRLGKGHWGRCNKNFAESAQLEWQACRYNAHTGETYGCSDIACEGADGARCKIWGFAAALTGRRAEPMAAGSAG